jgi:hypothetical protein
MTLGCALVYATMHHDLDIFKDPLFWGLLYPWHSAGHLGRSRFGAEQFLFDRRHRSPGGPGQLANAAGKEVFKVSRHNRDLVIISPHCESRVTSD